MYSASNLMPREREETGNPLVVDAACGAGLSGAQRARRNWEPACGTERSAASAKKCEMINEQ
jgi:hypothetical protein